MLSTLCELEEIGSDKQTTGGWYQRLCGAAPNVSMASTLRRKWVSHSWFLDGDVFALSLDNIREDSFGT